MKKQLIGATVLQMIALTAYGEQNFGIDTVTINVPNGSVLGVVKDQFQAQKIFDLEKRLVDQLLQQVGINRQDLSPDIQANLAKSQTTNVDALVAFGKGLMALDENNFNEAERMFHHAHQIDSSFSMASSMADAMPRVTAANFDVNTASATQVTAMVNTQSSSTAQQSTQAILVGAATNSPASAMILSDALTAETNQAESESTINSEEPTVADAAETTADTQDTASEQTEQQQQQQQQETVEEQSAPQEVQEPTADDGEAGTQTTTLTEPPAPGSQGYSSSSSSALSCASDGCVGSMGAWLQSSGSGVDSYAPHYITNTVRGATDNGTFTIEQFSDTGAMTGGYIVISADKDMVSNVKATKFYETASGARNDGLSDSQSWSLTKGFVTPNSNPSTNYLELGFWSWGSFPDQAGNKDFNYFWGWAWGAVGDPTIDSKLADLRSGQAVYDYSGVAGADFEWAGATSGADYCTSCGTFSAQLDFGASQVKNLNINVETSEVELQITGTDNISLGSDGSFYFASWQNNANLEIGPKNAMASGGSGGGEGQVYGSNAEAVGGAFMVKGENSGTTYFANGNFGGARESN